MTDTAELTVIGCDPGPTTGICALHYRAGALVRHGFAQVSHNWVEMVLDTLTDDAASTLTPGDLIIAVERFVVGPRAARSSTPAAGQITRRLIETIASTYTGRDGIPVVQRSAAEVKPWASNSRLDAAGLLSSLAGMPHARDAARQAIYCAVHDRGVPDPLSRRGGP